jgi:hypothetical protein
MLLDEVFVAVDARKRGSDGHEAFGLMKRKRVEDQRFDDAVHERVRADGHGQREHGDGGEDRLRDEKTPGEADILHEVAHERTILRGRRK